MHLSLVPITLSRFLTRLGWEGTLHRCVGNIVDGAGQLAEFGASVFAINLGMIQHPFAQLAAPVAKKVAERMSSKPEAPKTGEENFSNFSSLVAHGLVGPLHSFLKSLEGGSASHGPWGMDWQSICGSSDRNMSLTAFMATVNWYKSDPEFTDPKSKASTRAQRILNSITEVSSNLLLEVDKWDQCSLT